jgi:hypothetical protein
VPGLPQRGLWNGHAAQIATGAASTTRNHCQPGNRDQGNTDSTIDRSVSGTKNTSARISLRRSRRTATSSAAKATSASAGLARLAE